MVRKSRDAEILYSLTIPLDRLRPRRFNGHQNFPFLRSFSHTSNGAVASVPT